MDSRPLKLLAAVTAVAALLFGWLAFVTSREENVTRPSAPVAAATEGWPRVVVAAAPLEKGTPIRAESLKLAPMQAAPAESYARLEDVAGATPAVPVGAGEVVTKTHFAGGSALAHSLGKSERAVAIQVNEVIGVGGLLQAGDFVDVVAYVAADGRQVNNSQARIILERARVLAYGNNGATRSGGNTAVLAVPAAEVPRLVLAANAGSLRLSLHGAQATVEAHLDRAAQLREMEGPEQRGGEQVLIIRGGTVSRVFQ